MRFSSRSFSRLSRQPLNKEVVQTEKLVRQVLEDLRAEHANRQIDLAVDALPPCQGDPSLLRQVWINLLSNAFKFTRHQDNARIEVGHRQIDSQGVYYVKDNGAGFEIEYADKLFGVFQRLHRAEDYEGTGVGLATVQRIIQRHGGKIWAEGEVGKGATFSFTLEGDTAGGRDAN